MSDYGEEDDISASNLIDHGTCVFSMFWDTGGMGGADYYYIYEYAGAYYHICLDEEVSGPYDTLVDAIEYHELGMINNATKQFHTIMKAEELFPLLYPNLDSVYLPYAFTINEEPWQVNEDGSITRAPGGEAAV